MSDAAEPLGNEVGLWFLGLDERVRGVLEAVYARDPAIAVSAITGREVTAEELGRHDTLAAALGVEGAASLLDLMPYITLARPVTINPPDPTSATPITVRWAETNEGAPSESHVSLLQVSDDSMNGLVVQEQPVGPLARGDETAFEIDIGFLKAGAHQVQIWCNKDGVPPGDEASATREHGMQTFVSLDFVVTAVETPPPLAGTIADEERVAAARAEYDAEDADDDEDAPVMPATRPTPPARPFVPAAANIYTEGEETEDESEGEEDDFEFAVATPQPSGVEPEEASTGEGTPYNQEGFES